MIFSNIIYGQKQIDDKNYFPMSVGNKWEYEYNIPTGDIIANGKFLRITTIKEESDGNFLFVETNYIGNLPAIKQYHIYECRNDMLMKVATGGGAQNTPIKQLDLKPVLIKYPIQLNSSWSYKDEKQQLHFLKIAKKHNTVSVLGKAYKNVIEVSDSVENVQIEYNYYAYNVGLIKIESILVDTTEYKNQEGLKIFPPAIRSVTFQLKSYKLK
jgi:hypothetical protein